MVFEIIYLYRYGLGSERCVRDKKFFIEYLATHLGGGVAPPPKSATTLNWMLMRSFLWVLLPTINCKKYINDNEQKQLKENEVQPGLSLHKKH